ncbi:AraC family transcriptional regulator [Paenibacillus sp. 598K]|uniref:GyrI-like domain-containing protein n=1 Tax=Paenibacillus sp. 598K TaxID=1117987 RepID=UPI000FFA9AA8|nr:GyrI-like domain-containing protein [Paenibacillus sp. 598K]GBF74495.1 AraC family transcriptional regulator [Paenibacillus sp. 598K]
MDNCTLVNKPSLNLTGLSYSGPYSTLPEQAIRLQSEFLARKHELNNDVKSSIVYSPFHGNEVFATYWACFETAHLEEVPEGMVQFTVPEHAYAMVTCTNERMGEGYEQIAAWMAEHKLQKDDNAVTIEVFYIDEHLEEEPVDILIPIKEAALPRT